MLQAWLLVVMEDCMIGLLSSTLIHCMSAVGIAPAYCKYPHVSSFPQSPQSPRTHTYTHTPCPSFLLLPGGLPADTPAK